MNDIGKADQKRLKALGAAGVLVVGDNMQAIFGSRSENLKTDIEEYLTPVGRIHRTVVSGRRSDQVVPHAVGAAGARPSGWEG